MQESPVNRIDVAAAARYPPYGTPAQPTPPSITHIESDHFRPMRIAPMEDHERDFARHVKLACLIIIASAMIYMAMDRLQGILIPFALAVALSYLLTPLIDLLTCRGRKGCRFRLPRFIAVILSLMVAVSVLTFIALVLVRALTTFKERSDVYKQRVGALIRHMISLVEQYWPQPSSGASDGSPAPREERPIEIEQMLSGFLKDVNLSAIILQLEGCARHGGRHVHRPLPRLHARARIARRRPGDPHDLVGRKVERQIFVYIRGKSSISAFVGGCHAAVLFALGLACGCPLACSPSSTSSPTSAWRPCCCRCRSPPRPRLPPRRSPRSRCPLRQPLRKGLSRAHPDRPVDLAASRRGAAAILIYGSVWGIVGMVMAIRSRRSCAFTSLGRAPAAAVCRAKARGHQHAPGQQG